MTIQAISTSSLICMGRDRRAAMIRAMNPVTGANYATGFLNGMHIPSPADTERTLVKDELQCLPQRALTLRCISGKIWLTRHGDGEDHILEPGQALTVGRDDQAVVQGLRDSRFCLGPA
jgi:hypothetical protein